MIEEDDRDRLKIQEINSLETSQLGDSLMQKSLQFIFLGLLIFLAGCAPAVVFNPQSASGDLINISGTWEGFIELQSTYFSTPSGINSEKKKYSEEKHKVTILFDKPNQNGEVNGSVIEYRAYVSGKSFEQRFYNFPAHGNTEYAYWSYQGTGITLKSYKAKYSGKFSQNTFLGSMISVDELAVSTQRPDSGAISQVSEYIVHLNKIN